MDIDQTFTYHAPSPDQIERMADIREHARLFAHKIEAHCPPSHERGFALRQLQQVSMWANAAIAIHEDEPDDPPPEAGL